MTSTIGRAHSARLNENGLSLLWFSSVVVNNLIEKKVAVAKSMRSWWLSSLVNPMSIDQAVVGRCDTRSNLIRAIPDAPTSVYWATNSNCSRIDRVLGQVKHNKSERINVLNSSLLLLLPVSGTPSIVLSLDHGSMLCPWSPWMTQGCPQHHGRCSASQEEGL